MVCFRNQCWPCGQQWRGPCNQRWGWPCNQRWGWPCNQQWRGPCCQQWEQPCCQQWEQPCCQQWEQPCCQQWEQPCCQQWREPCQQWEQPCSHQWEGTRCFHSGYQCRPHEEHHKEHGNEEHRIGCCNNKEQKHVHEIQGSVEIAEREEDPHNHRFATVTGEAQRIECGDHVHEVFFRTDTYEDHDHEFCGVTGGAIPVGDRHVHFLESVTMEADGHRHVFRFASLIEDPIGE